MLADAVDENPVQSCDQALIYFEKQYVIIWEQSNNKSPGIQRLGLVIFSGTFFAWPSRHRDHATFLSAQITVCLGLE